MKENENQLCRAIINIDYLEPTFISLFGIKIPYNLKPTLVDEIAAPKLDKERLNNSTELEGIKLIDAYSKEDKEVWASNNKIRKDNIEKGRLLTKHQINCLSQCRHGKCWQKWLVDDFVDAVKEFPMTREQRGKLKSSVGFSWLMNDVGKENQLRGLTVEGLRGLPLGLYHIGQQDSSSKGYFVYRSTAPNRKVKIRFVVWNMYDNSLRSDSKRDQLLQDFFNGFNEFEILSEEYVESLFFFLDPFVDSQLEIVLKNGLRIEKDQFGMDLDFEEILNEIVRAS